MLLADTFSAADEGKGQQRTKKRSSKDEKPAPLTQQEVLQDMEKEKQAAIEKDEEKLRDEAKKIVQLQQKIDKKEQKYAEMEKILGEERKNGAVLQTEKLKEAELQLKSLQEGYYPESSLKEKIEEVFHGVKDFTKDLLFSDHPNRLAGNQRPAHEQMGKNSEKKLKAITKRIEDLKNELAKNLAEKIEKDNEKLRKRANEIEELKQQLKNEERKYTEMEEEIAYDRLCEAKILEAERKLEGKKSLTEMLIVATNTMNVKVTD